MGSQMTREADGVLYTRAGLEIGVAATKTFVAQVTALYLLALSLAELRGTLERGERIRLISELRRLPHLITQLIEDAVADLATSFCESCGTAFSGSQKKISTSILPSEISAPTC